jgi:hypothetical protein
MKSSNMKMFLVVVAVSLMVAALLPVVNAAEARNTSMMYEDSTLGGYNKGYQLNKRCGNTERVRACNTRYLTCDEAGSNREYKKLEFKGVWLYENSETPDGYVKGYAIKKTGNHSRIIIRGAWNTSNSDLKGVILGLAKNGYFAGRIITINDTMVPAAGIYKVNIEEQTVTVRLITPSRTIIAYLEYKEI